MYSKQIRRKYLGCGYKGLVFCRNNGWIMKDMDCSKMGTESLAENTPNAQKHFCPICRPKPKSSEFQ